jgi:arginyl-tRNA synthetase
VRTGVVAVELGHRVAAALKTALDVDITAAEALVQPSSRTGVDYQCNVAMGMGKKLGRPPREIAAAVAEHLKADDLIEEPEIAGPGFLNLVLRDEWLEEHAVSLLGDDRLGAGPVEKPRRIAIDYGSPNVAKEMHVGHLRSAIIGDAIARLLRFQGHEVIPHNHLGDWGTPFGMLIEHLIGEGTTTEYRIGDLTSFYQAARTRFDTDTAFAERSRRRVVLLQRGDEPTMDLWRTLVAESTRYFETVYDLLGIELTPADIYGESFYNPFLGEIITELESAGLTEISDGAVCVFPPGFTNRDGDGLPLIVRKRDGGYGYAITDLATVRYWTADRGAAELLYVVGSPQAQHFAMVFAVCRQAGWLTEGQRARLIGFGTILGEDGKTMRSRAGKSVKLVDLLTEAVDRAATIVAARSELSADEQAGVARAVGIGSVKYADLSSDRERDYSFDLERMLGTEGNTGVYLQYANARIQSILRKSGEAATTAGLRLTAPAERELLLTLIRFPAAVESAGETHAPHKLCTFLYETATAFSRFYEQCPILKDDVPAEVRGSRLALARLTSNTLTLGLSLLGIDAPSPM